VNRNACDVIPEKLALSGAESGPTEMPSMVLCQSRDLGEMTTRTMELRKLSGVNSATVSLNREVLFANKFIHSLVREKILATVI
jgi:hypothetical protein